MFEYFTKFGRMPIRMWTSTGQTQNHTRSALGLGFEGQMGFGFSCTPLGCPLGIRWWPSLAGFSFIC